MCEELIKAEVAITCQSSVRPVERLVFGPKSSRVCVCVCMCGFSFPFHCVNGLGGVIYMSLLHHTTCTGVHSTVFASSPRTDTTFRPTAVRLLVVSLLRTSSLLSLLVPPSTAAFRTSGNTIRLTDAVVCSQPSVHISGGTFGTEDTEMWPDAHVWVVFVTWEAANAQH